LSVARKETEKYEKETKTNKRQCPLSSVKVKLHEDSPVCLTVAYTFLSFYLFVLF